jgi:hypothetical protein
VFFQEVGMNSSGETVTLVRLAKRAHVHPVTARAALRRGEFVAVNVGGRWRIPLAEAERWARLRRSRQPERRGRPRRKEVSRD